MISISAAASIFVQFLTYYPHHDETVLSFVRADAWTSACAVLFTLLEGKGGKQSTQFEERFITLFPKALLAKIGNILSALKSLKPEEPIFRSLDTIPVSMVQPTLTHVAQHSCY